MRHRLCRGFVGLRAWVFAIPAQPADARLPAYGGDQGGIRFSPAAQITLGNVAELRRQWLYRTGDAAARSAGMMKGIKFETTPILVEDRLVLCRSFNEVIALDPSSGCELWRYDPKVATDRRPVNRYNCRGVAQWRNPSARARDRCATRIFSGTVDARPIAIDARDGVPCPGSGNQGEITIDTGAPVFPVEERAVPQQGAPGEVLAPTQTFPVDLPALGEEGRGWWYRHVDQPGGRFVLGLVGAGVVLLLSGAAFMLRRGLRSGRRSNAGESR